MAKKIRFPLKLAEDKEVRTLEELREHFDLEKVLEYYKNGKLLTWLEDRYLEGEAEAVRVLDETKPDFQRQLCLVFQVEYTGSDVNLEEIERRQERLKRLREITDDVEFIQNIDRIAFDQEDLADLLDEGQKRIYLCGEIFQIPVSQKDITYIGINGPVVHLTGDIPEDMQKTGIVCENCRPDNWPEKIPTSVKEFLAQASQQLSTEELTVELSFAWFSELVHGSLDELLEKISFHSSLYHSVEKMSDNIKLRVFEDVKARRYWGHDLIAEVYSAKAEVVGIHLDSGRKGCRTIQVDLKQPLSLGDAQYNHVPILSTEFYEGLGLRKGAVVRVHRVGDTIPSITVIEKGDGNKLMPPETCPFCSGKLTIKNKMLYCRFAGCSGNLIGRITGFLEGVGMDGYGDSFVKVLIETCNVKQIDDIFDLEEKSFEDASLTGEIYRQFSANLRNAISDTPDYKVLGSIGIPDVGPARAKAILKEYNGWDAFAKEWANVDSGNFINHMLDTKIWESLSRDARWTMYYGIASTIRILRDLVKNITTQFDTD